MNQKTVKVTHVVFKLARLAIDWSKLVELYASALHAFTVMPFIGGMVEAASAENGLNREGKVDANKHVDKSSITGNFSLDNFVFFPRNIALMNCFVVVAC
jgi:hypothetical protein